MHENIGSIYSLSIANFESKSKFLFQKDLLFFALPYKFTYFCDGLGDDGLGGH